MTKELPALSSRHHVGRIARLAWPLLIGQLAIIANGVIDTVMVSRFSALDLGALALGVSIYISVFVGLSGVLQALQPTIGQLFGAGRLDEIGNEVKQGMWLAVLLSIVGSLVLMFAPLLLAFAKASPELVGKATLYLRIEALALPATLLFRVYSSLNTAMARPKMVMALQVGGLALKLPLNALLIFGGLGLPAFGGPGCAIATTVIAWLMMLAAWLLVARLPLYRPLKLFGTGFVAPSWKIQRNLLLLGIPIGMSYFIEVTAFTLMAVFIARLGAVPVAGHQIAGNVGTVLYMLPLSIASATSTLVAQAIGGANMAEARKIGRAGIRLAVSLSAVMGVIVWFMRVHIIHAYTPDPVILGAALPLFLYIAFYQLFDSMQVTTAFVLRAYKVAVVPTVIYAVTLWGVGLGGGYVLGLDPLGMAPAALHGPVGFWAANSVSLGLVAVGLLAYLRVIQQRAARGELNV
ncbi:MATE family efflux transporter [Herbaspirillum rubrisubalbicans]|uniref:Multidrug-efflux transporter n=1 Tax=Herbaspirillum rubrisubalbicans TaxID=80842 RepID=A0AAD0U4C0_9BURK|nr:MATE family efflux transporter [Herbaspirillum rubrisubalbicans]ALU87943.1 inner membrane transmembrane (Na+-driven multidrug efflux pump) protein [Herbaspirillum rubrisubalbicans M1]AYR22982.1 MATE family efflux transporter [Herbaspirillum rubrisubalbicans]